MRCISIFDVPGWGAMEGLPGGPKGACTKGVSARALHVDTIVRQSRRRSVAVVARVKAGVGCVHTWWVAQYMVARGRRGEVFYTAQVKQTISQHTMHPFGAPFAASLRRFFRLIRASFFA